MCYPGKDYQEAGAEIGVPEMQEQEAASHQEMQAF